MDDSMETGTCSSCGSQYVMDKPPVNINIGSINLSDGWVFSPEKKDIFEMSKTEYAIPFTRDDRQAKQDLLCKLISYDNSPIDIAYKANIKSIKREYYPFAFFEITGIADWEATSIWEHIEKYQVPRSETVYFDRQGREHSKPGSEYINGNRYNYRPQTRTVYDTKTRTVTDNIERTSGSISPVTIPVRVWVSPAESDYLKDSISGWIRLDQEYNEIDDQYLKDFDTIAIGKTVEEATESAKLTAQKEFANRAESEVPGTRFEDFSISGEFSRIFMVYRYLPVYHISYEYDGTEFEYLITGVEQEDLQYIKEHPVDEGIEKKAAAIKRDISSLFWSEVAWIIMAIAGGLIGLHALAFLLSNLQSALNIVICSIFLLIGAGMIFFGGRKSSEFNKKHYKAKKMQKDFKENVASLKQKIYDLIQDDSIPDEGKGATIEGWIREADLGL
ncbi:MAG: hypothetical protein K5745_08980 [Saccharofermentans sp.]|nr:hypothetical protein [Saccharofermentans sp.]